MDEGKEYSTPGSLPNLLKTMVITINQSRLPETVNLLTYYVLTGIPIGLIRFYFCNVSRKTNKRTNAITKHKTANTNLQFDQALQ